VYYFGTVLFIFIVCSTQQGQIAQGDKAVNVATVPIEHLGYPSRSEMHQEGFGTEVIHQKNEGSSSMPIDYRGVYFGIILPEKRRGCSLVGFDSSV
jgi:hypothetical protein